MRRRLPASLLALLLLCFGIALRSASAEQALDPLWAQLPVEEVERAAGAEGTSFAQYARQFLSGEMPDLSQWPERIWQMLKQALTGCALRAAGILAAACVCELLRALAGQRDPSVRRSLDLLCEIVAALTLLSMAGELLDSVEAVCDRLRAFAGAASPVLVAALTLTGAPSMAVAMTPSAAAADGIAVFLASKVGLPLVRVAAMLAACAGISGRFRLNRLFKLCISVLKWTLGACMTGFLALMSAQSVALGGHDSATVQAARFAVDNLLPIIGSEVADTVGSVFASACLVKNAAGFAICLCVASMLLAPAARLVAAVLMLKLLSACLEMIDASRLSALSDRFAQVAEAALAILAAVAALGIILAGAAIFTAGARS